MKLLICCSYYYYGHVRGVEPQFYYLYKVPETLGYEVDFFDYYMAARIGVEQMRRLLLAIVKGRQYDAVFIATHKDELDQATLGEMGRSCPVIAWNSDDEWRWEDYSKPRASWYTFMVTNSPEVYANNRSSFPNLLHAQWACTGFWDGQATPKDIDFSFVGRVYGTRAQQIRWLARRAQLRAYGAGAGTIVLDAQRTQGWRARIKRTMQHTVLRYLVPGLAGDLSTISFEQVNQLWNRSKISFTPLDSSQGGVRQIKSRVFDMGLSGTLMLAQRAPYLDSYYEPEQEYIPFDTLEECAARARFYLQNEAARRKIAAAYARRTTAEHMWAHRIQAVLRDAGIA
ncbi:MAG TPA: glycosyltransferase [Roseiflexaceae bacterium]|nr:glycosyltransferase [Roseiflexaceae bacterium]